MPDPTTDVLHDSLDDGSEDRSPHRRPGRLRPLGLGLRLALAAGMIAGISLYALQARRPPGAPAPEAGPPPSAAAPATAPAALALTPARLRLSDPSADPVRVEPARVAAGGTLREDAVARGAFDAVDAPAFHLTLSRGPGAGRAPGLFVLLARRAADPGLAVVRTGPYGRIATKFGAVETLEATLAGPVRRTCTAFVSREAGVRVDGWLCAPLGRPPEPQALACLIDGLGLDDPADPAAVAAFREAEARRDPACGSRASASDPAGRTGSIAARPRK